MAVLERTTVPLGCQLTDSEILDRSREVAALITRCGVLDQERKKANAEYKQRIEECETELKILVQQVRTGVEVREIPVETHAEGTEAVTYRTDTGEMILRRKLTPTERQGALFPIEGDLHRAAERAPQGDAA